METIYIKKQAKDEKSDQFYYVIPAVGIKTREGVRLIPHPYGNETTCFDTLEKTIEHVHRAGYSADFEGKRYPVPLKKSSRKIRPRLHTMKASALSYIIEEAIPALQDQLNDNVPAVIASAAFALGEIKDEGAMSGLIHALGNEDPAVRKNVTEALAKIGKPALQAIRLSLKDKHWLVRHSALAAIQELTHLGFEQIPDILPDALPLLKDESWLVRSQAAMLFGEVAKTYQSLQEKESELLRQSSE